MRPVEHAPEAIIEAGQELQAAGRNITGFALRQRVGGGNPSRLKQVWDDHLASQSVIRAEPVVELPVELAEEMAEVAKALTERLNVFAVRLNDKAVKAAEWRVRDVVRAAGEQREQAERELSDASQTVEALEAQFDQAVGGEAAVAAKLVELRESLVVAEQSAKAVQALHLQEIGQLRDALAEERRSGIAVGIERDQARDALVALKSKTDALEWSHQDYIKTAEKGAQKNEELAAQAKAGRDLALKDSAEAREASAQLRGQLEATLLQNEALLRKLTA